MRRVRWYTADWSGVLRRITSKMRTNPFTHDSHDGFLLDRIRGEEVSGRYVEKYSISQDIADPFGQIEHYERIEFQQVEFTLSPKFPHIELWDSPRSTHSFISKLTEYSNFAITISPIACDLIEWVEALSERTGTEVIITGMQIAGLEVSRGVSAKIVMRGDTDVREAARRLAKQRPYNVEKVHAALKLPATLIALDLSSNGSVKLDESVAEEIIAPLRTSIPR